MSRIFGLFALTCFLVITACSESSIIGKWEMAKPSSSGLGQTIEFKSDGTCAVTMGAIVNAMYTVVKDSLRTTFSDGSKQSVQILLQNDVLIEKFGKGQEIRMKRISSKVKGDAPIIGAWSGLYYMGTTAFTTFGGMAG